MAEEYIWDPLRKKNVPLTPEERVRQWFISVMEHDMGIPKYKMNSEVSLKYGETLVQKDFRADIVAFDRAGNPVMIVECKRPEVELTEDVIRQALVYDIVLKSRYIVITNGQKTHIFEKNSEDKWDFASKVPTWEEMAGPAKLK